MKRVSEGPFRAWIPVYFVLAMVLVGGAYVRLNGLAQLSFENDEVLHVYAAQSLLENGTPTLPSGLEYDRAFLYTRVVSLSFKLFGIDEFAARLPSVLFGMLTIILVFVISKELFGSTVAIIAATLIAFLPFEVVWSRTCRMYSMYQFMYLVTAFASYRVLEHNTPGFFKPKPREEIRTSPVSCTGTPVQLLWLSTAIVALFLTRNLHPLTLLLGASLGVYSLLSTGYRLVTDGPRRAVDTRHFLLLVLLSSAGLVALMLPETRDWIVGFTQFSSPTGRSMDPLYYSRFLFSDHMKPVGVFFTLGAALVFVRRHKPGFYLLVLITLPLVAHAVLAGIQRPRYIYELMPFMVIVTAYALYTVAHVGSQAFERLCRKCFQARQSMVKSVRGVPVLIFAVSFLVIFPGSLHSFTIPAFQPSDFGSFFHGAWREGCSYIDDRFEPGDIVIAGLPLVADFYDCTNIKYHLDNWSLSRYKVDENGSRLSDVYDVHAITDLTELRTAVTEHSQGWLIYDPRRFSNVPNVPEEIHEFVEQSMVDHSAGLLDIVVFSWGK